MNQKTSEQIEELTLMLAYLLRFRERNGEVYKSYKGYNFDVINKLEDDGYLTQSRKIIYFGQDGIRKAQTLLKKYGLEDYDF